MTNLLKRADLIRLWNALVIKITEEDLKWLQSHRGEVWKSFDNPKEQIVSEPGITSWQIDHLIRNMYCLAFRIQDIVDAKFRKEPRMIVGHFRDRKEPDYFFAEGMPKEYVVEIAKLLGIVSKDIDSNAVKMSKWEIMPKIFEKIGE